MPLTHKRRRTLIWNKRRGNTEIMFIVVSKFLGHFYFTKIPKREELGGGGHSSSPRYSS